MDASRPIWLLTKSRVINDRSVFVVIMTDRKDKYNDDRTMRDFIRSFVEGVIFENKQLPPPTRTGLFRFHYIPRGFSVYNGPTVINVNIWGTIFWKDCRVPNNCSVRVLPHIVRTIVVVAPKSTHERTRVTTYICREYKYFTLLLAYNIQCSCKAQQKGFFYTKYTLQFSGLRDPAQNSA